MSETCRAPYESLRGYLAKLDATGRLRRVAAAVDPCDELACVARWSLEAARDEGAYAILFENVNGARVAVNLFTTRELYAAALGCAANDVLNHWADALEHPIAPKVIERGAVFEDVACGDDADLSSIPAPTWTPGRDAGAYLSAASVITKDPDTGVQNLASYRVQIHDGRHAGLFFGSKLQHGALHLRKWRERGEAMPVALVVGAAPAVCFAAAAKTAYGVDELSIAGGLSNRAVSVSQARTVDLLVPADAECVIEGFVRPDASREEGPFGEALGYVNWAAPAPEIEVTAICRRRGAIHHGYVQQLPPSDGHRVMELGALGPLWHALTRQLGLRGVTDLAIAPGAAGLSFLLVQVSAAANVSAITQALTKLRFGQRIVCIVDDDIDIHDSGTINWAISTRVDPETDMHIVGETPSYLYDPAVLKRAERNAEPIDSPPYSSTLVLIDATIRCRVPDLALAGASRMRSVRDRWAEFGLPALRCVARLERLLDKHANDGADCAAIGGRAASHES